MKEKAKEILSGCAVMISAALLIWAGKECFSETADAAALCITVMIPSLFAFTAVSRLLISTESYRLAGRPFSLISRYIFRLPEDFFPLFLISQIAGYPIGAAMISAMEKDSRITRKQAEEYLCFCIAPSPAYVMTVSMAAAPSRPEAWKGVFLSCIGANLLLALLTSPMRPIPQKEHTPAKPRLSAALVTEGVRSASESMAMFCGMIILMSAAMGVMSKAGLLSGLSLAASKAFSVPPSQVFPFVRSFFDISSLSRISGNDGIIPAAAAFLTFGGLCVHMQIASVCGGVSPKKALFCRIPCALVSYAFCRMIIPKFCPVQAIPVMAPVNREPVFGEYSPLLSIFLLIMTILILSQKNMVKTEKM